MPVDWQKVTCSLRGQQIRVTRKVEEKSKHHGTHKSLTNTDSLAAIVSYDVKKIKQ